MREKTLWDFLNIAKLFNKKDFLILQGSTSLFLHGVIKRIPHDIDILFHNSLSLKKRNELWNIFIKNFQIIKYEVNNELVKKCFVSINEESLKIESILGKNISDYFIDQTFLSIKTTNINYFFASKIIQLSNSFNIQYKSIVDRNNKINNILNDINELIEKYEISIDELIKSLIENIKSNIGYEIISLRNHYYDNLLFLYDLLITNYFFVSKQIEVFLSTFKNNLKLINFLEKLTICFNAKNYFVYSLFSNRQIKEKSSNFSNYGTLFTLEKNSFNLNLIKNFLFLLGNNEEIMNEYISTHSNKLIVKIDLLLPIIKYLEN